MGHWRRSQILQHISFQNKTALLPDLHLIYREEEQHINYEKNDFSMKNTGSKKFCDAYYRGSYSILYRSYVQ